VRLGSTVLPTNAEFSRVEEAQYVKGMTPEIFARARPYLTLMGTGQVNLNMAPRPVLLSLPGISDEAVAVLERTRGSAQPIRSVQELSLQLSSAARSTLVEAMPSLRELHVRSDGWTDGSPVHVWLDALVVRAGAVAVVVFRKAS
jgi:type II secretory pathway component PulK